MKNLIWMTDESTVFIIEYGSIYYSKILSCQTYKIKSIDPHKYIYILDMEPSIRVPHALDLLFFY